MRFPVHAPTRRTFVKTTLAGAAAASASLQGISTARAEDKQDKAGKPARHAVCAFTKPFQKMSYDELADAMSRVGLDGVEFPLRRGGHIEPKNANKELPKLVEALKKKNLDVTLFASSINEDTPDNRDLLKLAAELGIKRYRMAYYKYDHKKPIAQQLTAVKGRFASVAKMNEALGVQGVYQNHAGRNYVGGPMWDLRELLGDLPRKDASMCFDIRHATAENGQSWATTFHALRPIIDFIYVKDFVWKGSRLVNVPLGEGRVDPKFIGMLKQTGYTGPISLHVEYVPHNQSDDKTLDEIVDSFKKDYQTLRGWLKKYSIG